MTEGGWSYYGDLFAVCTNVESLCHTPENNILFVDYTLIIKLHVNINNSDDIYHSDLYKRNLCTDELFLNTEGWFQFWTVRMGMIPVVIITLGRQKLFLKELPGGQRVTPEGRKKKSAFPSLFLIVEL